MHDDYRNFLFESYMKVVDYFKPEACIFENVPGMLSAAPGGVPIVERIRQAFENSGYAISENFKEQATFDVSDFGIPQKRKRVIIAAFRKTAFKDADAKVNEFYSILDSHRVAVKNTVSKALCNLPKIVPMKVPEKRSSHQVVGNAALAECVSDHDPRYHNTRDVEIFRLLAHDIESGNCRYTSAQALQ
jgi:DNA (cytosine-5)-methyltransferase 1